MIISGAVDQCWLHKRLFLSSVLNNAAVVYYMILDIPERVIQTLTDGVADVIP